MKLVLIFALSLLFPLTSFAKSDAEIREAYNGCMTFLKMSHTNQRKVANKSGYSLDRCLWGCHLMQKNGLKKSIALEHEYQREISTPSAGGGGGAASSSDDSSSSNECSSSIMCPGVGMYQCINHHCQDISPPFHQCDSGVNSCALGEQCVDGVCH